MCVENTHNTAGGKAVSGEWIAQVAHICRARKIPLHCDGARIFNAAVALREGSNSTQQLSNYIEMSRRWA